MKDALKTSTKRCQECGGRVPVQAHYCIHCGGDLWQQSPATEQPESEPPVEPARRPGTSLRSSSR